MSKQRTCEICQLKTGRVDNVKRTFMARFPLNEDRCKMWVQLTGKEDLVYVPIEKLHQLKFICGNHFKPKDFNKYKTQLKKNAIPSIGITRNPLSDEMLIGFPLHLYKNDEMDNHSLPVDEDEPSASRFSNIDLSVITREHEYCKPKMLGTVCRICLRSDFTRTGDIHEILSDFHDEICEYDAYQNPVLQFCPLCEHLLRKFYKFREKCKKAHSILKSAANRKLPLDDLHKLTTPSTVGFSNPNSFQKVFHIKSEVNNHKNNTPNLNIDDDTHTKTKTSTLVSDKIHYSKLNVDANGKIISKLHFDIDDKVISEEINKELRSKIQKASSTLNQSETNPPTKTQKQLQFKMHIDNKLLNQNCGPKADDTIKEKNDSVTEYFKNFLSTGKLNEKIDGVNHKSLMNFMLQDNDIEIADDMEIENDIEYIESDLDDNEKESIESLKSIEANETNEIKRKEDHNKISDESKLIKLRPVENNLLEFSKLNKINLIKIQHVTDNVFKIKPDNQTIKQDEKNLTKIRLDKKTMALYEDINIPELLRIEHTEEMPETIRNFNRYKQGYAFKFYKQKEIILDLLKSGELRELGDGVSMSEELYLKLLNNNISHVRIAVVTASTRLKVLKKHLVDLCKRNNPEYHTLFTIERLDTKDKKIAEFQGRRAEHWFESAFFKCESCITTFKTKFDLMAHIKKLHDRTNFQVCPICSIRCSTEASLVRHMWTLHAFHYRCKRCAFVSTNNVEMVRHYDWHRASHLVCPLCDTQFYNKLFYKSHMERHKAKGEIIPNSMFPCDTCGAELATRDLLQQHIARGHERRFRSLLCCGESFNSIEDKRAHQMTCPRRGSKTKNTKKPQTKVRDFEYRTCPICQETVKNEHKLSLYNHHKANHPDAPFQNHHTRNRELCNHCGKIYPSTVFHDHVNTHTGERNYECACGARFATFRRLYIHRETHKPPLLCPKCGKYFNTKYTLKIHLRTVHSTRPRERKYTCRMCPKAFLTNNNLQTHIKGVHYKSLPIYAKRKPKPVKAMEERDTMITLK